MISFGAEYFVLQFSIEKLKDEDIQNYNFLRVVLYGCETWSLTLWEKRRLRVFENRVLRGIFGHKSDEVTGEWRKLHNEELNDLYCSSKFLWGDKMEKNKIFGACSEYGGEVYK